MPEDRVQPWAFHNPTRLRFGAGSRKELLPLVKGGRVLVVTSAGGRKRFEADGALGGLDAEIEWLDSVAENPGLADVQAAIDARAETDYDAVIAFGGGSAMDAAKALTAALSPSVACRDLATLVASPGAYLTSPLLPLYAIPTTSGTGSEVTPFATLWDYGARKKLSLASPWLFPAAAIVDPELVYSLPHWPTFSTGLDALNQAFESVWNRQRTPLTLLMAARGIRLALEALPRLHQDLDDHEARGRMAEASLLAGLCISQTRTAICHSISYPLTAHFGVPHGLACAFTMGKVARLCDRQHPNTLTELAPLAGFSSSTALVEALCDLLGVIGVEARVRSMVPSSTAALALRAEMYTPGRSDNFVLPVSDALIDELIGDW